MIGQALLLIVAWCWQQSCSTRPLSIWLITCSHLCSQHQDCQGQQRWCRTHPELYSSVCVCCFSRWNDRGLRNRAAEQTTMTKGTAQQSWYAMIRHEGYSLKTSATPTSARCRHAPQSTAISGPRNVPSSWKCSTTSAACVRLSNALVVQRAPLTAKSNAPSAVAFMKKR